MADLFDSARLTFARAQHHITDFKSAITQFIGEKPQTYFVDTDSQPGKHVHKVTFTRDMPQMLPCILFDAVNNLRSVLDQAGAAAARASGKASPKATSFPFRDDP